MTIPEVGECCLCGHAYEHFGNNPEPLMSFDAGRCCDSCNARKVIPARLRGVFIAKPKAV